MNTWHLKPKSCQWSKNVNAERSRHYSDSNPLCSEHKTTLQGLSTVHLECTAYVTRDREKLDLRETGGLVGDVLALDIINTFNVFAYEQEQPVWLRVFWK